VDAVEGRLGAVDAVEGRRVAEDAVEGRRVAEDAVEGCLVAEDAIEDRPIEGQTVHQGEDGKQDGVQLRHLTQYLIKVSIKSFYFYYQTF
jgi:hypothetical protein